MQEQQVARTKVRDFMVRGTVTVHPWQPVAYARQAHVDEFIHVSSSQNRGPVEAAPRRFHAKASSPRRPPEKDGTRHVNRKCCVSEDGPLVLVNARVVKPDDDVAGLLDDVNQNLPTLWLVDDENGGLSGVLSPFDLM